MLFYYNLYQNITHVFVILEVDLYDNREISSYDHKLRAEVPRNMAKGLRMKPKKYAIIRKSWKSLFKNRMARNLLSMSL